MNVETSVVLIVGIVSLSVTAAIISFFSSSQEEIEVAVNSPAIISGNNRSDLMLCRNDDTPI